MSGPIDLQAFTDAVLRAVPIIVGIGAIFVGAMVVVFRR